MRGDIHIEECKVDVFTHGKGIYVNLQRTIRGFPIAWGHWECSSLEGGDVLR